MEKFILIVVWIVGVLSVVGVAQIDIGPFWFRNPATIRYVVIAVLLLSWGILGGVMGNRNRNENGRKSEGRG